MGVTPTQQLLTLLTPERWRCAVVAALMTASVLGTRGGAAPSLGGQHPVGWGRAGGCIHIPLEVTLWGPHHPGGWVTVTQTWGGGGGPSP